MKVLKRLALALFSVAMLFTLTSCGGNSGTPSTEAQLTSKINDRLSDTGIHVTYDSKLNEKLLVYIDVYNNSQNEDAALKASGLDLEHYAAYLSTSNSTLDDTAAILAGQISAEKKSSGRIAKNIGYANGKLTNGSSVIFALVYFS